MNHEQADIAHLCQAATLSVVLALSFSGLARADGLAESGIIRVKSAYSRAETIARVKQDIAAKGIRFFDEIDQSQLAADAGIQIRPSTLLVFGNPPLGTQFIRSNALAGLDWPVRLLVFEDEQGQGVDCLHRFWLHCPPPRHSRDGSGSLPQGDRRHRVDHVERESAISGATIP